MTSESSQKEGLQANRILIDLEELSGKQRKVVLTILKELGFGPGEIDELVILLKAGDEEGSD